MDPKGNIYVGHPDELPPEDVARLDGYLKARAELAEQAHAEYEAELQRRAEAALKSHESSEQ